VVSTPQILQSHVKQGKKQHESSAESTQRSRDKVAEFVDIIHDTLSKLEEIVLQIYISFKVIV